MEGGSKLPKLLNNYPPCDGFDFPVGKPNARGYYNAQKFTVNNHLGEDWNGVSGGNTDLRDPVYSTADGMIFFAKDVGGGWGNIIRIVHKYWKNGEIKYIESFYAHLKDILIKEGKYLKGGIKLGLSAM